MITQDRRNHIGIGNESINHHEAFIWYNKWSKSL